MRKTDWRRLLCAVLCIIFLCSCAAPVEVPRDSMEEKASRPEPKVEIEVEWIETLAEIPEGDPELSGRLWEGPMPEGVDLRNRIYTDCRGSMYLLDLDGNLVHWGNSWDDISFGWNSEDGIQPYAQRSVLKENVQKYAPGYRAALLVDDQQDLWGWGPNFDLLMYDGDPYNPPEEPIKILSGVKDAAAGDFDTAVVRTDGRLQVWGRGEGYEKPVTLQTGIEKVCSAGFLMYIDQQHHLYCYPEGWSSSQKTRLLDCDVDDVSFLSWNFFLERKTDGSVWIAHPNGEPVLLAEDSISLAYDGYITPDGTFWSCQESEEAFHLTIQPMDSACSIIGSGNSGSVHIMKDGEIRVCLYED